MKYNFNEFIKNKDIKGLLINLLYLYNYNRIDKGTIENHIEIFNEINNTSFFIQYIYNNIIEISNGKRYLKIEL